MCLPSGAELSGESPARIEGAGAVPMQDLQITLRVRADYSIAHLRGAALFTADCRPLEEGYEWPATEEVLLRHSAASSGAVVLSVAALEAFANELYLAAEYGLKSSIESVVKASPLIFTLWDTVERTSLIRKFQWMLELSRLSTFPQGASPMQEITDLIALRNLLVHYKTEWTDDARRSEQIQKRLNGRFAENELCNSGQLFFPYRCLGYGCGAWAVRSVLGFVQQYCERLGIRYRFGKFEEEILTYVGT